MDVPNPTQTPIKKLVNEPSSAEKTIITLGTEFSTPTATAMLKQQTHHSYISLVGCHSESAVIKRLRPAQRLEAITRYFHRAQKPNSTSVT